jgi:hypothetical protein
MPVTTSIQVYGVKAALKELQKTDPALRRAFLKKYKDIVKPVIDQAKASFPQSAPLSGMIRPYKKLGGWNGGMVAKGVVAKIDTRKGRSEVVGAYLIQQKTGWGSIFDMAGKSNGSSVFASNLGARFGGASRSMWPAYTANATEIESAVLDLVGEVMAEVGRNVVSSGN